MVANPYEQARWTAVEAADPLELVLLLFTRTLECVSRARYAIAQGDIPGRTNAIQGAMDCMIELTHSLRREQQPELVHRLLELYSFVLDRLRDANYRQQSAPLDEAEPVLRTLLEAWVECRARLQPAEPAPETSSLVEACA